MNPVQAVQKIKDMLLTPDASQRLTQYGDYGWNHLWEMCDKIQDGRVEGEKAHRWLGYIQGVLVSHQVGTLEEMKLMNTQTEF